MFKLLTVNNHYKEVTNKLKVLEQNYKYYKEYKINLTNVQLIYNNVNNKYQY